MILMWKIDIKKWRIFENLKFKIQHIKLFYFLRVDSSLYKVTYEDENKIEVNSNKKKDKFGFGITKMWRSMILSDLN